MAIPSEQYFHDEKKAFEYLESIRWADGIVCPHCGVAGGRVYALEGKSTSLKDLRGKVVLLNFWATWCGPCRAEKPILQKVYSDLKDKGFMVLAITDEDPAVVRRFVNESHITLPVFIDLTRAVFDHYLVEGIPKTIILNQRGQTVTTLMPISDEGELRDALAAAGLSR